MLHNAWKPLSEKCAMLVGGVFDLMNNITIHVVSEKQAKLNFNYSSLNKSSGRKTLSPSP